MYGQGFQGDPYADETTGRYVRDYRDEFGNIVPKDLEQQGDIHTDAATGMRWNNETADIALLFDDAGDDDTGNLRDWLVLTPSSAAAEPVATTKE